MHVRNTIRRQRYDNKRKYARTFPFSIVTVNFTFNQNIASIIRSAACYGASSIMVIGSVPPRSFLNSKTGSLIDYVDIKKFRNPREFLKYAKSEVGMDVVSVELAYNSERIYNYKFNYNKNIAIVIGNESSGIPEEIYLNSDSVIHIPMPGVGYCLNAAQAGTVVMHEYVRGINSN